LGWGYVTHFGALEVADSREFRRLYLPRAKINGAGVTCPSFSADGRILAATSGEAVSFWNAYSGQPIASLPVSCDSYIFQPDGQGLIVTDWIKGVRRLGLEHMGDPASPACRLGKPQSLYDEPGLDQGVLSRDGRYFACANSEGHSLILDLKNQSAKPVVLRSDPTVADRIAISPDGHWAATSSWHNSLVQIWDARSGELVHTLSMPGRTLAAFSPDGRWLATSTKEYQLWETGSWRPKGPPQSGCDVPEWNFTAFSPDGRLMARTLEGTKIELLETATSVTLATLEAPDAIGLSEFQFSPDGSYLAVMQWDQQVQLWNLRLIRQDLKEMHLDWDAPPFSPVEQSANASPVRLEIESDPASQTEAPPKF
jgi:WD40 repeat protein